MAAGHRRRPFVFGQEVRQIDVFQILSCLCRPILRHFSLATVLLEQPSVKAVQIVKCRKQDPKERQPERDPNHQRNQRR